jgi:hypothetical protein
MGIYATTTSFSEFLIGTTLDTATTNLLSKCIDWSQDEINKYLSKRYDISSFYTSTASVPPLITTWCENMSEGFYHMRNSRGGKESIKRGEKIHDMVMGNLKDIAEYKFALTDSSGAELSEKTNTSFLIKENTSSYSPTFNEDSPLNWKIDSDKLDDISDERD